VEQLSILLESRNHSGAPNPDWKPGTKTQQERSKSRTLSKKPKECGTRQVFLRLEGRSGVTAHAEMNWKGCATRLARVTPR